MSCRTPGGSRGIAHTVPKQFSEGGKFSPFSGGLDCSCFDELEHSLNHSDTHERSASCDAPIDRAPFRLAPIRRVRV